MKGESVMEGNVKETLCLLLDGELDPEASRELLDRIESDPELGKQWWRYCVIRESMKSGRIIMPDANFVARVGSALADEPTIVAPRPRFRRIPERLVTGALAAGLLLMAVLVGLSLNQPHPLITKGSDLLAAAALRPPSARSPIDPEFREYLVTHYETAYLAGAQGMLPSVRLVSSDSVR